MRFRHEIKHEISKTDMLILRQKLRAVMKSDPHAIGGIYEIRSLYFDTPDDKALREKIDGVNEREKYRIRLYNRDKSMIRLERKYKYGGLGFKESAVLTPEQANAVAMGETDWMASSKDPVIADFYKKICHQRLGAKVLVDYTREPYIFAPGNVRVTFDYNIRTGLTCTDLFAPEGMTVPIKDSPCILEVKWDEYLPDIIRDAIQLENRHGAAFSKYAACRMYE